MAATTTDNEPIITGFVWGDAIIAMVATGLANSMVVMVVLGSGTPVVAVLFLGVLASGVWAMVRKGMRSPRLDALLGVSGVHFSILGVAVVTIGAVSASFGLLSMLLLLGPGLDSPAAYRSGFIAYGQAGPGAWLTLATAVGVLTPTIEELGYRGLMLRAFARSYRAAVAVLLSALLFSISHAPGGVGVMLASFFLGAVCGSSALAAASTMPAIIIHVTWNVVGVSAGRFSFDSADTAASTPIGIILIVGGVVTLYTGLKRLRSFRDDVAARV